MRKSLTVKLVVVAALLVGCANADVLYTTTPGQSDTNGPVAGSADFFILCSPTCNLFITLQNTNTVTPGSSLGNGQGLSGVSFQLSGITTALGSLNSTITGDKSDGGVGIVPGTGNGEIYTAPAQWGVGEATGSGLTTYTLSDIGHSGGPQYLIVPDEAGAGTNISSKHQPSMLGPVTFEITGITGLTTSTVVSDVSILFGTTPDFTSTSETCSSSDGGTCGGGTGGGPGGATPEPISFLLAGGGLIALACTRRRFFPAK